MPLRACLVAAGGMIAEAAWERRVRWEECCRNGLGRAGVILAALVLRRDLMEAGVSPNDANFGRCCRTLDRCFGDDVIPVECER